MEGCQTWSCLYAPIHPYTPIHSFGCPHTFIYPPYVQTPPEICMSPYPVNLYVFPLWYGDGAICTPQMFWGLGGHQHICQTIWCLSVHSFVFLLITAMPVAPHYCGLLLYWTGCLWMSVMFHAVVPFFVVFIKSQASTTMARSTTLQLTVVSSGTSSLLSTIIMAPSLMGLHATLDQHDVFLLPPLTPRHLEVL